MAFGVSLLGLAILLAAAARGVRHGRRWGWRTAVAVAALGILWGLAMAVVGAIGLVYALAPLSWPCPSWSRATSSSPRQKPGSRALDARPVDGVPSQLAAWRPTWPRGAKGDFGPLGAIDGPLVRATRGSMWSAASLAPCQSKERKGKGATEP
jgi:hypothetical protein